MFSESFRSIFIIRSLMSLFFLNHTSACDISYSIYGKHLCCKILSITLLTLEINVMISHYKFWHLCFLGLECVLNFPFGGIEYVECMGNDYNFANDFQKITRK